MKLLIVDGLNLLFQMFFGIPTAFQNKDGVPVHAVVGFMGALNKMLQMVQPQKVVVLFDSPTHNPRVDIDQDYKANREDYSNVDDAQNPFLQLPLIYKVLDVCGIKHAEAQLCETDDLVASYVQKYRQNYQIIIASFDSDYFQLVDENVTVLRYRGKRSTVCDSNFILQKYGVLPCQFADYKCLVGDQSDNVKHIVGIGPKTAQKLLGDFKTLQNLMDNAHLIKNAKLSTSICNGKQRLVCNEKLIRLHGGFPLPFTIEELDSPVPFKTMDALKSAGL